MMQDDLLYRIWHRGDFGFFVGMSGIEIRDWLFREYPNENRQMLYRASFIIFLETMRWNMR